MTAGGTGQSYHCTCRRCGMVIAAKERIADDALRALGDHVRAVHPCVRLRDAASAGDVLGYFDVTPVW